jgi:hypothetical protein
VPRIVLWAAKRIKAASRLFARGLRRTIEMTREFEDLQT